MVPFLQTLKRTSWSFKRFSTSARYRISYRQRRVLAHNSNDLNHAVYINELMKETMLSKCIFSFFAGICMSESWNLLAYSGMFCRGYARPRTRKPERLHTVESAPSWTTGKTEINEEKMRCFFSLLGFCPGLESFIQKNSLDSHRNSTGIKSRSIVALVMCSSKDNVLRF